MKAWPAFLALALLVAPAQPALGGEGPRQDDLGVYHTFGEMVSELQNLTAAHPAILRMESIGKTYEGRDIWAVKLSDNVALDEAEPNITIFGGIHAGELIGVEVALHILFSLVENYTTDPNVGWYVNSTQIWFVPMLNPDGHVWVEQGNQWRKNRSPNPGGTFGTDLNRNFGHLWGLDASHNPPDDDYCGPYAFSENETQAVDRLVRAHPPKITLSYHSYGQYILYPWGNNINQEPVDPRLSQMAWNMSFAMPEGRRYLPMYAREMYSATGDTDDYFYMNLSILPFTIELATSNRPLDSQLPGICADNYGPVLYVLNYTVGSPPAPPPKREIDLTGLQDIHGRSGETVNLSLSVRNRGEVAEDVTLLATCADPNWTVDLQPPSVSLEPGENTTVLLAVGIPYNAPAFEAVQVSVNATSTGGPGAGGNITARVDRVVGLSVLIHKPYNAPPGNVSVTVRIFNSGNEAVIPTLSANTTSGWKVSVPVITEGIPQDEGLDVNLTVEIPPRLLAGTNTTLHVVLLADNGSYRSEDSENITVTALWNFRITLVPSTVNFTEGERRTVRILAVNNGNALEDKYLGTSDNENVTWVWDSVAVDLAPYSSRERTITVWGKAGNRTLGIRYPDHHGGYVEANLSINIRARPPSPDNRPMIIGVVIVVVIVVAVAIGLWWMYRSKLEESLGKESP